MDGQRRRQVGSGLWQEWVCLPGARADQGKGMACRSGHGRSPPNTQAEGQAWWGLHPSPPTGRDGSRAHPGRRGAKPSECPRPREEPSSLGFPGGPRVTLQRSGGLPMSCRHGGSGWQQPYQPSGALRKALGPNDSQIRGALGQAMRAPRFKHRGPCGGGRPETFARPVTRASREECGTEARHDRALSPLLVSCPCRWSSSLGELVFPEVPPAEGVRPADAK